MGKMFFPTTYVHDFEKYPENINETYLQHLKKNIFVFPSYIWNIITKMLQK